MWMHKFIEGREVLLTGSHRTQKVRIFGPFGRAYPFECKFKIADPIQFISSDEFISMMTWKDLSSLLAERGIDSAPLGSGQYEDRIPETALESDHKWAMDAIAVVEHTIDEFIKKFIQFPYLHRVEHSLHIDLFQMLALNPALGGRYPFCGDSEITHCIHKEWPTEPSPNSNPQEGKRGNFDLAVLSPGKIAACSAAAFKEGRITPEIAIEMGLNYNIKHLEDDLKKILEYGVGHGYLIHLVRDKAGDIAQDEVFRIMVEHGPRVKTAYARVQGGQATYKLLADKELKQWPRKGDGPPA